MESNETANRVIHVIAPAKSPAARIRRVRISWFLLGTVFGLSASFGGHWLAAPGAPAETPAAESTAPAEEKSHSDAAPALPAAMQLRVGRGDTLVSLLTDTGVAADEAEEAVAALRKVYDPRKLDIGQQVAVSLNPSKHDPAAPVLSRLSLPVSKTAHVELERTGSGAFNARKVEAPVEKTLARISGPIMSSFYATGMRLGIPANTLHELMKVYSYDVDFQRDVKRGDRLDVLVERTQTKDGTVVSTGNVVYAALDLGERKVAVYRFADKNGNVGYYNEKGESLRKALLRTPINGARITSGFGMRMHPLLGYSKMHRGVDFGAAQGTPIYAAGDGIVTFAGWKTGYGNYVQLKHSANYATAYGHASRIASGIKPGSRVKQGQVIAYVGSTGQSTGPHLHYEVLANGAQVNPAGVKFKTGTALAGVELKRFKAQIGQVQLALKARSDQKVASR